MSSRYPYTRPNTCYACNRQEIAYQGENLCPIHDRKRFVELAVKDIEKQAKRDDKDLHPDPEEYQFTPQAIKYRRLMRLYWKKYAGRTQ